MELRHLRCFLFYNLGAALLVCVLLWMLKKPSGLTSDDTRPV